MSGAAFEGASRPGRDVVGYTTSVRFLYFGLPLGAEVLRRAGFVPHVASFGHRMSGLRRVRARLAPLVVATDRTSAPLATERPLLLFKPDLNDRGIVQALASARPDAILSWFWPTQIPPAVLSLAPRGAFGVHPSLLPRHRGPDPYFHAIREGDAETGVTLHRLEAAYDTGHVVAQRRVPITARDDAWRLARKLDRPSLALLVECAQRLSRGETLEGVAQDESLATEAPQPTEEELCLDWDASADEIVRLVRAAAPAPMVSTLLGDELVFVRRAVRYEREVPDVFEPGDALRTPDGIVVVAGEGAVRLVEVEREDGERVRERDIDRLVPTI
jgi:methionyl-tRNA formyltransferase